MFVSPSEGEIEKILWVDWGIGGDGNRRDLVRWGGRNGRVKYGERLLKQVSIYGVIWNPTSAETSWNL